MQDPGPVLEIEIKLAVAGAAEAKSLLDRLPAALASPRAFEDNEIFDFPDGPLGEAQKLLRLRVVDGAGTITFKETVASDLRAKVRAELESRVSSPEALRTILRKLGLVTVYRYQKYRSYYRWTDPVGGQGLCISLDETPMGVFLELEGDPQAIDRAAGILGKAPDDYILEDYRSLHGQWLRERGRPSGDMVFPGPEPAGS